MSQTYIMGEESIFFDRSIFEHLKDHLFWWRLTFYYHSIWRVLHIDRFEGPLWSPHLPNPGGHIRIVFNYDLKAKLKQN